MIDLITLLFIFQGGVMLIALVSSIYVYFFIPEGKVLVFETPNILKTAKGKIADGMISTRLGTWIINSRPIAMRDSVLKKYYTSFIVCPDSKYTLPCPFLMVDKKGRTLKTLTEGITDIKGYDEILAKILQAENEKVKPRSFKEIIQASFISDLIKAGEDNGITGMLIPLFFGIIMGCLIGFLVSQNFFPMEVIAEPIKEMAKNNTRVINFLIW